MPNLTNTRPDHVVFDSRRKEMVCRHCGSAQPVAMPIRVTDLVEMTNAYLDQHEGCVAQVVSPAAMAQAGGGR